MVDLNKLWDGPCLVRLKRQVGLVPEGSVGTVVDIWADGEAAEVEFYVRNIYGEEHERYVETVELEDMDDA